ncbi:hypothetical protein PYH37_002965 [Sinorhizobium numidicum]|uniref:Cell envelope integrity protein TolA n=1 Tax=Sinorhizobium numidicum TaxID=680248 RepID=A0ABY8D344_9HYPH|nr:hypothetical protein [Sinorhizobium numidicum]WEX78113.1 hypothetical protein PYH37_002965 [Sinorhizobium numidicum]WEX84772.1 hypothetical protein PYH38_003678 [Sinorhizobium numidicum]
MNVVAGLALTGVLLVSTTDQLRAEPLNTVEDLGAALSNCWTPPPGIKNSFVTLRFGFKADGTLLGRPQPTAINVTGDEKQRQAFVDAATEAMQNCVPLEFSNELGKEIAGNVFTLQFRSRE